MIGFSGKTSRGEEELVVGPAGSSLILLEVEAVEAEAEYCGSSSSQSVSDPGEGDTDARTSSRKKEARNSEQRRVPACAAHGGCSVAHAVPEGALASFTGLPVPQWRDQPGWRLLLVWCFVHRRWQRPRYVLALAV